MEARHGRRAPWPSVGPHTSRRSTCTTREANEMPPLCARVGRAEVRPSRTPGAQSAGLRPARRPPPPPHAASGQARRRRTAWCALQPHRRVPHTPAGHGGAPPPRASGPGTGATPPPHLTRTVEGCTSPPLPPKPLGVLPRGLPGQDLGTPPTLPAPPRGASATGRLRGGSPSANHGGDASAKPGHTGTTRTPPPPPLTSTPPEGARSPSWDWPKETTPPPTRANRRPARRAPNRDARRRPWKVNRER